MLLASLLLSPYVGSYEFVFISQAPLKSVSVAGTFNSWNKDTDQLAPNPSKTKWTLKKQIAYGDHQYKFVLNNENWITDPNAKSITDQSGHTNSLLTVLPADYSSPAVKGDGTIATSLLGEFKPPTATGNELRFTFNTRPNDVESVSVLVNKTKLELTKTAGDRFVSLYSGTMPFEEGRFSYSVQDGEKTLEFPGGQITSSLKTKIQVPTWAKQQVFYQIFPDRFLNGDQSNDPQGTEAWGSNPTYFNFMGGDLAGVEAKIPYLKSLGISGIYFNPIFDGPSNHGYVTTDYRLIDKNLGTNNQFSQLSNSLRDQKIKVVLDGVFNHTSTEFAPFQDLLKNQSQSRYKNWYFVNSFPIQVKANPTYEGWAGFADLPKLNILQPEAQKYILESVDFWHQSAHIDGWRLDVANEVAPEFWQTFRKRLKAKDQTTWIMGENWTDSSPWLQGDQWDSTMNYPVRGAILNFLAFQNTSAQDFADELFRAYLIYPKHVSDNTLTFLSTHDTPRVLTLSNNNPDQALLAATALFAWPGVPCIYYGDELGMEGGADPDNRQAMKWEKANDQNRFLNHYKALVSARKSSRELQEGTPELLISDNKNSVVAFSRNLPDSCAITLLNNSDSNQLIKITLPPHLAKTAREQTYRDALTQKNIKVSSTGQLIWSAPRRSGAILLPVQNSISLLNQSSDSGKLQ